MQKITRSKNLLLIKKQFCLTQDRWKLLVKLVKNIPGDVRSDYPQIDWKGFAGLRDIIIHQYFGIDYEAIWDTVINEIPETLIEIERIIKSKGK